MNSTNEIKIDNIEEMYENFSPIGEGSYGVVYRAVNVKINKLVAVKIYKEKYVKENYEEILEEIRIIKQFKHPNLINLNQSFIFEK